MNEEPSGPPAPPQYSDDGKWWWDGSNWAPAPVPQRKPLNVKLVVAVMLALLVVAALYTDWQAEQEAGELLCETYGAC